MSLVLTATAQSGTYALAKGYLYTKEAFRSYLDHLEPAGALAMIDDSFERTLKNTVTAAAVFEHTLGLRSDEAMKRVAVLFNPKGEPGYKYLLLSRRRRYRTSGFVGWQPRSRVGPSMLCGCPAWRRPNNFRR